MANKFNRLTRETVLVFFLFALYAFEYSLIELPYICSCMQLLVEAVNVPLKLARYAQVFFAIFQI